MKSVFLTSENIKVGSEVSLPAIIRLVQNSERNLGNEETIIEKRKNQAGTIGNNYFDFSMDFTCAPIQIGSGNDPFKDINNILQNKALPTFTREYFMKYIVLEIPDFGHQAMSLGFRDFVPHIYINGLKLWQKYVGIIRQYSKKVAYIIIPEINNLGITKDKLTKDSIKIRIIYKNNIEDKNINNLTNTSLGQQYRIFNKVPSDRKGYIKYNIENANEFIYLNLKNPSDYDIYYKVNGNEYKLLMLDNFVKIEHNKNGSYDLSRQNMDSKKEYFRQSYIHDYAGKDGVTYDRDIKSTLSFYLSKQVYSEDELDSVNMLYIRSRQNSYNAYYINKLPLSKEFIPFNSIEELNFFDASGKKIYAPITSVEYEVIPEYDSRKKVIINNNSNSEISNFKIGKALNYLNVYPYNDFDSDKKFEYLTYNSNGLTGMASTTMITRLPGNSTLEVYIDLIEDITETASDNSSLTAYESLELYKVSNNNTYLDDTSIFKKQLSIDESGKIDESPVATIIYKLNGNDDTDSFDIVSVCRCFPIVYEKEVINPGIIAFKYPEWMFLGDDGETSMNYFHSMENNLYIIGSKPTGKLYIPTHSIGSHEGSYELDMFNVSGNLNIINIKDNSTTAKVI